MLKSKIKKALFHIQGGYKPEKFWDQWSKTFMDDPWQVQIHPQHQWLLRNIQNLQPASILEIGCGFGRNIKFLIENGIDPSTITGIDISHNMIQKARSFVRNDEITLEHSHPTMLQFHDNEFDLSFTHGVLMHVMPDDIRRVLSEIVRITQKNLLFIEQNYDGNEYTFIHDYKTLLSPYADIVEYESHKDLGLDLIYAKVRK